MKLLQSCTRLGYVCLSYRLSSIRNLQVLKRLFLTISELIQVPELLPSYKELQVALTYGLLQHTHTPTHYTGALGGGGGGGWRVEGQFSIHNRRGHSKIAGSFIAGLLMIERGLIINS